MIKEGRGGKRMKKRKKKEERERKERRKNAWKGVEKGRRGKGKIRMNSCIMIWNGEVSLLFTSLGNNK